MLVFEIPLAYNLFMAQAKKGRLTPEQKDFLEEFIYRVK
jgi:hypothetical protein